MSTTTTKRGTGAKFLALLASLTMMIAGLVGVALAAPASANSNPRTECSAFKGWDGTYDKITFPATSSGAATITYDTGSDFSGTWATTKDVVGVVVKSGSKSDPGVKYDSPTAGTWTTNAGEGENQQLSHITFCYGDKDTYTYFASGSFTKEICKNNQTQTPEAVEAEVKVGPQPDPISQSQIDDAEIQADKDAEAAFNEKYDPYTSGPCPEKKPFDGAASASGSGTYCTPGGETVNVSWSGRATATSTESVEAANAAAQPGADAAAATDKANKTAGLTEGACPPPPSTPPTPVVEAAVVAAPEAATAAPAPATVAVPAAATLPAQVPAGEGSDTGLPMAALAMIALGMIGAAFAGKQLLGARK